MMKQFKFFSFFCIISCLFGANLAFATQQKYETENYTTSKTKQFNLPPRDEIDPALLDEMDIVYGECIKSPGDSGHRDCKCYAMAFLQERIKTPSIDRGMVMNAIENECLDPEKMKGFYFGQCMESHLTRRLLAKKPVDPVKLCNCYANKVVADVLKLNTFYSTAIKEIRYNAFNACK